MLTREHIIYLASEVCDKATAEKLAGDIEVTLQARYGQYDTPEYCLANIVTAMVIVTNRLLAMATERGRTTDSQVVQDGQTNTQGESSNYAN